MRRMVTALLTAALALGAPLAGATTALACSLPPPHEGQIQGFRLDAGPGGDPAVAWWEYREDAPELARAAALVGGAWAWAPPGGGAAPAAEGIPAGAEVSEAGDAAVAVWQQGTAISAASRSAGGTFGPPQLLADEPAYFFGGFSMSPTVALGPGGQAIALWTQSRLEPPLGSPDPVQRVERRVVRAADRAPDGTWSAPYDLASGAARPTFVSSCGPWRSERAAVAIDGAGTAVAIWDSWLADLGRSEAMWSARPAGGAWAAPTRLTTGTAYGVQLELDASGTAHAAWIEDRALRSARRPAGGAFGPAEVLGPATGVAVELEVDGAGRSVAVWQRSGLVLSAATRPAGGPWGPPVDLTALEKPGGAPRIMERLRISRATMRQPACAIRRPALRACRAAGAALSFRLNAAAEVRVTIRRRGRAKALRGLRLRAEAGSHRIVVGTRPLPPGRYTIRIRVTAEGRAPEVATERLVVRPA